METLKLKTTTKQELERLAREQRRTPEDILERLLATYRFDQTLAEIGPKIGRQFNRLGITTIDEAEAYLSS